MACAGDCKSPSTQKRASHAEPGRAQVSEYRVRRTLALSCGDLQSPSFPAASGYLAGLALVLGVYVFVWYLPHQAELRRVNAYYLHHQLLPDSLRHLWQNVQHAVFGDDRGLIALSVPAYARYVRLALVWLLRTRQNTIGLLLLPSSLYLVWLLLTWAMLAVISYAPDRYYILFYPALCGLAALALMRYTGAVRHGCGSHAGSGRCSADFWPTIWARRFYIIRASLRKFACTLLRRWNARNACAVRPECVTMAGTARACRQGFCLPRSCRVGACALRLDGGLAATHCATRSATPTDGLPRICPPTAF